MRLIDADRLKNVIDRNFAYSDGFKQLIDAQPTAYDVDKVVEDIKKIEDGYDVVADAYQRGAGNGAKWAKKKAIEIVKGGVVDEQDI